MGRFATLNPETKDIVNCLLPGIAANFGVSNVVDVIPQEIRMREWDCDRREHIIGQSEDDPRNWGVQFLKDLVTISRLNKGNLSEFQAKLKDKVQKHEPHHPWAKLQDIKDIKDDYEAPERGVEVSSARGRAHSSDRSSSEDSYLEELVEEEPKQSKKRSRKSRGHEVYEARAQQPTKRRKQGSSQRLRRSSSAGWERRESSGRSRQARQSSHRQTPISKSVNARRQSKGIKTEREESVNESITELSVPDLLTPSRATPRQGRSLSYISHSDDDENFEDLSIHHLQAELDVAEAELKAARLRLKFLEERRKAAADTDFGSPGTMEEPHLLD